MRRRLYYVMPDHASARRILDDLLLAHIEFRHIHFLAKRGTSMDGLHEANVLQKTDIVHGAKLGTALGAALGCIAGGLLIWFPPTDGIPQVIAVGVATMRRRRLRRVDIEHGRGGRAELAAQAFRKGDRGRKDPADGRCARNTWSKTYTHC